MHVRNVCTMASMMVRTAILWQKEVYARHCLPWWHPNNPCREIYIMKFGQTVSTALSWSALLVALSGCQKNEDQTEQTVKKAG